MSREDEPLITREMLGLFVVFGADIIIFVVLLGVGGVISLWTVGGVTGSVFAVYGVWVLVRWRRLQREPTPDPVATLQQRYAAGELTDEEFENRLSGVLGSSSVTEPTNETEGTGELATDRSR